MGRVRAAKSKVRTGCRTCKARRVKCDEAKPACNRCSSTGRECLGYEITTQKAASHGHPPKYILPGKPPVPAGTASSNILSTPNAIPGASVDETNYFGFFCRYTAPTISGAFASQFFERFVLQLSYREPMIRYAATALGALQRAQERNGKVTLGQEEAGFALRQYGKAINLAREKLLAPDLASQRLELVACVLFVCFEIAQKRFKETAMHLENGMNLLVNVRHRGSLPSGWDTESFDNSDDAAALDREIARTFDRLDIQSTFVRSTRPKLATDPVAIARKTPRKFSGLEQAREYLSVLTRSISTFRHEVRAMPSPLTGEDEQALKRQQMQIRHQMQAWNAAFGSLRLSQVPLPPNSPLPPDVTARAVLEAMAVSASILLETGVADGSECIFDNFTSDFKLLVDLGQIAKDHPRTSVSSHLPNGGASFHIHMGSIPTVYIVALKCRDPVIRRRALDLLESFPFREGMWDAPVGAALCRHIMEVEEEGYEQLTCAQDLPEKARLHEALFDITDWNRDGVPVYYRRRDFEGEYGRSGTWLNWSRRVHVARSCRCEEAGTDSTWRCSVRTHSIISETNRCLHCNRHAHEIEARGSEAGWNRCHWDQATKDITLDHISASPEQSPFDEMASHYLPKPGPPGRGPAELLLSRWKTQSNNTMRSHHSGSSGDYGGGADVDESYATAFDGADLSIFAATLSHSPEQLQAMSS